MSSKQFIQQAVIPAQTSQKEYNVPASVTIAQAILESGWGKHHIGDANNYFGIKAYQKNGSVHFGNIAIGYVEVPTREVVHGQDVTVMAFFRKYSNMTDSFRDHGHFLRKNSRYAQAFAYTSNPDEFAREIHRVGYATDPNYAKVLIKLMRQYNLYQYDLNKPGIDPQYPTPLTDEYPLLRIGDRGDWVRFAQALLASNGFDLDVDGIFGPRTDTTVRQFQANNNLVSDGIIGPNTWAALL